MRILRTENHRRMPWKNGGGVTTEIAVFPEGSGLDDFDWRISMATVASDGPFSRFPGVDRTLAVLEGEGIVLSIEGDGERELTRETPPLAFPADRPTTARLISGPIVDFNVMTRRGRFGHAVERASGRHSIADRGAAHTIVFAAGNAVVLSSAGERMILARHDAAILDAAGELDAGDDAGAYVVTLVAR